MRLPQLWVALRHCAPLSAPQHETKTDKFTQSAQDDGRHAQVSPRAPHSQRTRSGALSAVALRAERSRRSYAAGDRIKIDRWGRRVHAFIRAAARRDRNGIECGECQETARNPPICACHAMACSTPAMLIEPSPNSKLR